MRLTDGRCPQEAGGRLCAVRADLPGLRQRHRKCVRPRIPGFSPGGLGPHLTSSGSPRGLSSGFPFRPLGSPPSPAFLRFPVVRRLRFVPFGRCRFRFPFGVPPGSLPLSNLHDSAAARRFRRRWSRAARAKVTVSRRRHPSPGSRRDPSRTTNGQRLGTMGCRYRIACYERPRAQDTAAPEPPPRFGLQLRRISRWVPVAHRGRLAARPPDAATSSSCLPTSGRTASLPRTRCPAGSAVVPAARISST